MQTARVLTAVLLLSVATACRQPAPTASAAPVLVDPRGRILIIQGSDFTGLSSKGVAEWALDLRGRSIWRGVVSPNGDVYLQDGRAVSRWTLPR